MLFDIYVPSKRIKSYYSNSGIVLLFNDGVIIVASAHSRLFSELPIRNTSQPVLLFIIKYIEIKSAK